MIENPSVPTATMLGHVVVDDVVRAIDWLSSAFGFVEHYRYGAPEGPVQGAQVHFGQAWLMLELARPGRATPRTLGAYTQMLTIVVDDVNAHYEAALRAGALIVEPINEPMYGERQYVAEDLDGHHWLFSQHARAVEPVSWGATVVAAPGFTR